MKKQAAAAKSVPRTSVVVEAPASRRTRRVLWAFGLLWTALQVAIPLRYYLGDDVYDERFAWRMFSAVRVRSCSALAEEEDLAGTRHRIDLGEVLPAPWASLIERNRPAVIEGFLAWRCARANPSWVSVRTRCNDTGGRELPARTWRIECSSGSIHEEEP